MDKIRQQIHVFAVDRAGNKTKHLIKIKREKFAPLFTLKNKTPVIVYGKTLFLSGTLEDMSGIKRINIFGKDKKIEKRKKLHWEHAITFSYEELRKETITIPIIYEDGWGNKDQKDIRCFLQYFPLRRMKIIQKYSSHTQRIWGLAYSDNKKYLITGGNDQKIHILDLKESKVLLEQDTEFVRSDNYYITPANRFLSKPLAELEKKLERAIGTRNLMGGYGEQVIRI